MSGMSGHWVGGALLFELVIAGRKSNPVSAGDHSSDFCIGNTYA